MKAPPPPHEDYPDFDYEADEDPEELVPFVTDDGEELITRREAALRHKPAPPELFANVIAELAADDDA